MFVTLRIDPKRISILASSRFTELVNTLIRADADKLGVPQHLIGTTVREQAPDEGIDAGIGAHVNLDGVWLPASSSAWQYKAGACPSVGRLRQTEFSKPGVQSAIAAGNPYVFCTAASISRAKKESIETAIGQLYKDQGLQPVGRVYAADQLANWVEQHLGIGAAFFEVPVVGWWPYEQWEAAPRLRNRFITDEKRSQVIDDLRGRIRRGARLTRIVGASDIGKTRTVLEALREDGLSERVLYIDDAERVDPNLFWHIRQETPRSSGILVVDECTPEAYARLEDLVGRLPDQYSVIVIGPRPETSQSVVAGDWLEVGPLSSEAMAAIVASFAPQLSEPLRLAVAQRSSESPGLLAFVSTEMARSGASVERWEELERTQGFVEFVTREVFPYRADDPESRLMRGLSLFQQVGWSQEAEDQGRAVAEFADLDWVQARNAARQLINRGVVGARGRFLFAKQDTLAIYLARDTIRAAPPDVLDRLLVTLGPSARLSLLRRLRQVGADPTTTAFVRRLFSDLLEVESIGQVAWDAVRILAPAFPDVFLPTLERLIEAAPPEELRALREGRRELVWALEDLAWWRDTFPAAARLLMRLALAENETYGNNATGIWSRLFQVVIGGTAAPFEDRRTLLTAALHDEDPRVRRLGVLGLGASLQVSLIHRLGGPPTDTGRIPPSEWRPKTHAEWSEIIIDSLRQLGDVVADPDQTVRAQVVDVLQRGAELIDRGFWAEWSALVERFANRPFEERSPLLEAVSWRLQHPSDLPLETRQHLEQLRDQLAGTSFGDQLKRLVGSWDVVGLDEKHKEFIAALDDLAADGIADRLALEAEIPWLFSGKAVSAFQFGRAVARNDPEGAWLEPLAGAWTPEVRDDTFVSGYLAGLKEARGTDWLEELLDDWVAQPQKALLVGTTTWRTLATERAARRLSTLFRSGGLSASFLGNLMAGFWARDLSPALVRELVESTEHDMSQGASLGRVRFLGQYIHEYPDRLELRDVALRVVDDAASHPLDTLSGHDWLELAKFLTESAPLIVARACVKAAIRDDHHAYELDYVRKAFYGAISQAPAEVFKEVMTPALSDHPEILWRLDTLFNGRQLLARFDPADVISWIEAGAAGTGSDSRDDRVRLIASAVPVEGVPLNALARQLLIRYRTLVHRALRATMATGSWSGSESEYYTRKLELAQTWAHDAEPEVQRWAQDLVSDLEKHIERVKIEEEEEEL